MSQYSTGLKDEPLVVRPKRARELLGVGKTKLYEMLQPGGPLERVRLGSGRAVGVTMRSIHKLVENIEK